MVTVTGWPGSTKFPPLCVVIYPQDYIHKSLNGSRWFIVGMLCGAMEERRMMMCDDHDEMCVMCDGCD